MLPDLNVKDLHMAAHDIWQHVLRSLVDVQACACDPAAEALAPSLLLTAQDLQLSELPKTLLSVMIIWEKSLRT